MFNLHCGVTIITIILYESFILYVAARAFIYANESHTNADVWR